MSALKIKKGATSHSAYNLRPNFSDVEERHTLAVLVENEPGVLARVIGLFSGRGYNIDSLTVAEVDHSGHLSRITIVTTGTPQVIEQIKAQLGRIVPVYKVNDLTVEGPSVERELAMFKVAGSGGKDRRFCRPDAPAGAGRCGAHRRGRPVARRLMKHGWVGADQPLPCYGVRTLGPFRCCPRLVAGKCNRFGPLVVAGGCDGQGLWCARGVGHVQLNVFGQPGRYIGAQVEADQIAYVKTKDTVLHGFRGLKKRQFNVIFAQDHSLAICKIAPQNHTKHTQPPQKMHSP